MPDPWTLVVDYTGHSDGYPVVVELRIQDKPPKHLFETQSRPQAFEWAARFMTLRGFSYTRSELSANRAQLTPVTTLQTQQGG